MNETQKNDVYYVCCIIEFIARMTKNRRKVIAEMLGMEGIKDLYENAQVNHCLTFEEVSYELISKYGIVNGDFDSVADCKYEVPTFMAIGKDYRRLVEDVLIDGDIVKTIYNVFTSFISDEISNFNSSVFYSSREYLAESYKAGFLLD